MARFSFFAPGIYLKNIESLSIELKIPGVELDDAVLSSSSQEILRISLESGITYVGINLNKDLQTYETGSLEKTALFCEANNIGAIIFNNPGSSYEAAELVLKTLSYFKIAAVFENKENSFLSKPEDMNQFFRNNRQALLCYNPAEMVNQKTHPFLTGLNGQTYRKNLFMVRVIERRYDGVYALPINGDSELCEIFSAAAGFGKNVWASISPYGGYTLQEIKKPMLEALLRI